MPRHHADHDSIEAGDQGRNHRDQQRPRMNQGLWKNQSPWATVSATTVPDRRLHRREAGIW
jgi:hypothetical protein